MSDIVNKIVFKELLDELKIHSEVAMLTYLENNDKKVLPYSKLNLSKDENLNDNIKSTFNTGIPHLYEDDNNRILIEPFFTKPRLIVFGGGHIALPLTEFGHRVGFSVVVADDRLSFANVDRFPMADEVICEDFNKAFDLIKLRSSDFVVIVTRGHRYDGVCLRNALKFNPAYIGMIGSKRRVKAMMEELISEGYEKEGLDKISSPIGLDIGAVTPEEIAIAIIAQVISYRRAGLDKTKPSKFNWPEFDIEVIKEASQESEIPRALITIIGSKGSVPRKAGAKMIVWLDGKTLGTIGGGCSEANILTLAREIIRTKGYSIEHVDMTGEVAEDEGMVCGGTMEVLIEAID